jgi:DNA-binding response OmpR family regulator
MDHAVVMLIGSAVHRLDQLRDLLDARTVVVLAPSAEVARTWLAGVSSPSQGGRDGQTLRVRSLEIDRSAHRVRWDNRRLPLTEREFQILVVLAEEPGRVSSFRELLGRVWQIDAHGDPAIVRAAIRRLRAKLASGGVDLRIEAVRSVGFRLDV